MHPCIHFMFIHSFVHLVGAPVWGATFFILHGRGRWDWASLQEGLGAGERGSSKEPGLHPWASWVPTRFH